VVESIAPEAHAYQFEGNLDQLFGRRARDPACGPCWITVVLTPRRYRARTPGSRHL